MATESHKERKRVAMISYSFYTHDGRIQRHVRNLVDAGYDVDLLSIRYSKKHEPEKREHVNFFYPAIRSYDRKGKQIMWDYLRFMVSCSGILMRRHFGGSRYCLVHVNNMPNFLVAAARPLRLLGVPILLDIHDTMAEIFQDKYGVEPDSRFVKFLMLEEKWSMERADWVVTTEHTKYDRLGENGLPKDRSCVVLNLPDPDIFDKMYTPQLNPPDAKEFRLVYHGTLAHRLGVDVGIRAMKLIRDKIPNAVFHVIGDGDQRSALVALAEELGLQDCVRFSDGFVPVTSLPELLAGADLAVLPSRENIATRYMLPCKLLEYVWMGIPCIAVPTHTITHYFKDNGVKYFKSEDPEDLAKLVLQLHGHPQERLEMAQTAQSFYQTHNFESERDRYLNAVNALITKNDK